MDPEMIGIPGEKIVVKAADEYTAEDLDKMV